MPFDPHRGFTKPILKIENPVDVPQAPEAVVPEIDPYEPITFDGSRFPRAFSATLRSMPEEEKLAFAAERHRVKQDPIALAEILGFDFVENPHRSLFNQFVPLPPLNEDGTAPDITMWDERYKKRLILWPRGVYKTSAVIVRIVQIILYWPNCRILFLTGSDSLGKAQLARVKKIFTQATPEFKRLFPEHCYVSKYNKQSKSWTDISGMPLGTSKAFSTPARTSSVSAEANMQVYTPKAVKAGFHADWIFVDDLQNEQNSRSEKMLENCWQNYLDIQPLLDQGGALVATGTRYSHVDIYARLQEVALAAGEASNWKTSVRSCFTWGCLNCDHTDADHDESTNILQPKCTKCNCIGFAKDSSARGVLFPQTITKKNKRIGTTLEGLDGLRLELGPGFFANQYENRPLADTEIVFTETLIGGQTIHDLEKMPKYLTPGSATFCIMDVAYSDANSDKSDLSVIYCFRKFQGALWVYKCVAGRWGSSELVAKVLQTLMSERPLRFFIEKNLGFDNLLNLIRATADSAGIKVLPFEGVGGASDNRKNAKSIRIGQCAAMMTSRRIFFYAGMEHYQTMVDQFCKWPKGGKRDDFADTIALLIQAPTGWALDSPPPPESVTHWLQRLHGSGPAEDSYTDTGAGSGVSCGGSTDESWK